MNRKKYLTESMVSDLGEQIVNNVYQTLMDYGYEQHEIDNIVTRDSIELDINNNECVLYCGNDIIFKTPGNILIHKFVTEAEDHLLQWCINKIGRKPNYLDANELFGDVPGWNNLNEAYGTDFEDTLAWVQKKFPNKSEKEQHQFAKNIMKRYVAPVETNSTDVVEKPKTRKNVKLIKIVDIPNHGKHQDVYCKSLLLRTARKPGDTERVNHTVLGRLNAAGVKYEIINENKNMNMNKKNTIRLTETELKTMITECVKTILKEHMEMPGDNGGYFDTSERINSKKSTWRGVPGTTFIYHGEWSDPEIAYKGELLNYWDVEEGLQYSYQADVESGDFEGSFDEWAEAQDPKYLASQLDDYIWAMQG